MEELQWCYPCYYDHFGPKIHKNTNIFFIFLKSVSFSIFTSFAFVMIAYSLTIDPTFNLTISNKIYVGLFTVVFIISIVSDFSSNKKKGRAEQNEFSEFKETLSLKINLDYQKDIFPIVCFYCEEKITPDSLTCLNINCTLGEELDESSQIVTIEPRKDGFFDGLRKLPEYSDTEN